MEISIAAIIASRQRELHAASRSIDYRGIERGRNTAAQAHVGDIAGLTDAGDIVYTRDHARVRSRAAPIEHADCNHAGTGGNPDHADGVVIGGNGSGDVRTMTVLIGRGSGAAQKAAAANGVDVEVGVRKLDPGINHPRGPKGASRATIDAGNAPWGGLGRLGGTTAARLAFDPDRRSRHDLVLLAIGDVRVGSLHPFNRLGWHMGVEALQRDTVDVLDLPALGFDRAVRFGLH